MFNRIKGTQDILDLTIVNFLISEVQKYFKLYHFTEISTPILEPVELFKRSLGTETDVVTKEMYTVNTGRDEESICLRPEATASTVRAFVNNNIQHTPWKVFSWGSMFRHERPQKGRYREFHQINCEIIGSNSVMQDAHFIKMLDRFFSEQLHLDSYALLINYLGCEQDRLAFKEVLRTFLEKNISQVCETCKIRKDKNILRVYDCKNTTCKEVYRTAPELIAHLCAACSLEWKSLKEVLELLSVSYSYNSTLVRGLDYYDKTVFEFVSTDLGAQNAFCGGGRYSQLAKIIGSREDQPSIGAAMGIERLVLMLESRKDTLSLAHEPALYCILPLMPEQQSLALLLADELQGRKLATEVFLEGDSLKSMMRQADKLRARSALIIGPDEQAARTVKVKDMMRGTEHTIEQKQLGEFLLSQSV